jgi:long-chain acyl-CoA synthetase
MPTADSIDSAEAGNLAELLTYRVAQTPDAIAYRQHDAAAERWQAFTWGQVARQVARWRQGLAGVGLEPAERVAVMLRNSVEWVLFDQAALSLGLVIVPLYTQDSFENAAFVLGDSGSRLLLVGKNTQWLGLAQHRRLFPALETVVVLDGQPQAENGIRVHHVPAWLPETGTAAAQDIAPDALASIVYTSGTTGRPKGVMLSHRNILSNAAAIAHVIPAYREDVFLSFLPLSHMLERTAGYYYPMLAGSEVAFARSIQTLMADLEHIRPTVLICVPRIFERAYGRIDEQLARTGALANHLFRLTEDIGWPRFEWAQGRARRPDWLHRLVWPVLQAVVAKRILARLGGRLRVTVSGGGRLDERIARRFLALGLPLLQGYGLTESSPVISCNSADDNLPESVGRPLRGVTVSIGDGGELLARGPGVMLGYWQRPEATAAAIDADGWLHTGDIAEIVDGRIFIRGRIKDILVTSTGEKVPSADLEAAIGRDPLFEQVLVVGEGKPYLSALIVLQPEAWRRFAAALDLDPSDPAALSAPPVNAAVLQRIAAQIHEFPAYARVRAVYLTLEPWTVDNGLMTPTQKLKRERVLGRFTDVIGAMYAGRELSQAAR